MKARLTLERDGKVAYVHLAAPKTNVLDRTMVTELDAIFTALEAKRDLRAIVILPDGPHFSFGASVEEHLPEEIEAALARLGNLLRRVAAAPAPTIAAVRGQCLGGGFELALACDFIIAEENAQLALPEIRLGVFPPAGSALLPLRVGLARATEMILTGASVSSDDACDHGLVARIAPPGELEAAVASFIDKFFMARSPSSLRHATRAVRRLVRHALNDALPELDHIYLDELMRQPDAVDGIRAFLEQRARATV
jgi:cyclohexa-1,5-dienecarbonyl-CoA hydratase